MTSSERVPPDANFFYYPRGPSAREAVHFIDLTPDRNEAIVSRAWRFGDGFTAAGPWPIHRFECGGDYDVELIVKTAAGGVASVTRTVRVGSD